jgi:hypothetical protein
MPCGRARHERVGNGCVGGFSGLPFRQRDWGLRSCSGDNRLAPIGPGYSKMFVFQTMMGRMVGGLGTKRSEMKRMDGGQAYT